MKKYNVYKIINDVNDIIYIGQTTETLSARFSRHIGYQLRTQNSKFYQAIRKIGKGHFSIQLIETCSNQEELNEREYFWLTTTPKDKLYNTRIECGKCGGKNPENVAKRPDVIKKIALSKMRWKKSTC